MNKKTLLISILVTILSVGLLLFLISMQKNTATRNDIGEFLFENTNKEGTKVEKIVIKMPKIQISLYYENKFWHIKEADGYFADLITINKLFQDLNNSKIEAIATGISLEEAGIKNNQDTIGIEIETYNNQGKMLDSVILGKKKNNYWYAAKSGEKQIYLISGIFDLSDNLKYWLQQPLISIEPKNISSFIMQTETGQQVAYKTSMESPFYNLQQKQINVMPLLEKFMLFMPQNAKKIQNTPLDSLKPNKIIVLFAYSGLIYGIEIFQIEEDFWIKVDLSINKLPTKIASQYIKESLFLYQGWAFKIDKNLGKFLLNYKIH